MISPMMTVSADTPAKEAAASMLAEGTCSVAVVGDDNRLVGILTVSIQATALIEHGVHHVPVVNDTRTSRGR